MSTTPQERLALGVVALLLAGGVGARLLRSGPEPAAWTGPPAAEASAAFLRDSVEGEVAREARRAAPLGAGERIDPNTAPAEELDRLPKVGPSVAAAIVAHREAGGRFRTLADLDAVPGVGPAVLAAVAPHVTLAPAPASASRPERTRRSAGRAPDVPSPGAPVDLNTADAEALATLPGIGPALARRIVDDRARSGRYGSVDALARVPGIGPATVERLRGLARATP